MRKPLLLTALLSYSIQVDMCETRGDVNEIQLYSQFLRPIYVVKHVVDAMMSQKMYKRLLPAWLW
jgi:hypothetical protein